MNKQIIKIVLALFLSLSSMYAQSGKIHTGKVLDTLNSGGYTYMQVLENADIFWVAVKVTKVKKGDNFSFVEQAWMTNFTSKTLNKTFDKILFASGTNEKNTNEEVYDLGQKSVFLKNNQKAVKAKVEEKTISAGQISEILANKVQLKDKVIRVKGEVVKVLRGIMKTSWIHIKDESNNKLIFRAASESVEMGDKVEAVGTLNTDVDYGYGYTYDVIVVNSTFTKI